MKYIFIRYSQTIVKYTGQIINLKQLLVKFIRDKDNDGCVLLTKLILAFAENQISILFNNILSTDDNTKSIMFQLLHLLLVCFTSLFFLISSLFFCSKQNFFYLYKM